MGFNKAMDLKTDCKTRTSKYWHRDITVKGYKPNEKIESSKYQVTIEGEIYLQREIEMSVSMARIYTNISPVTEANAERPHL